jgi:hypothetical protein
MKMLYILLVEGMGCLPKYVYLSNSRNCIFKIYAFAIQLILIICRFSIFELAYLLKLIGNPKISICGVFRVVHRHANTE